MKTKFFLALLLALLAACLAWPAGVEVVIMVDVSESMFPVFDDLVDYLLRDLLENRLHRGDSFHLLSFADNPETELTLKMEDASDLNAAIDRILLLKPLGQYTDLIAALEFLYGYTSSIPQQNKKLVLLLTDGIHDPPPNSPNRLDSEKALDRLLENTEKIKREGWDIHILRMPHPGEAATRLGTETEPSTAAEESEDTGALNLMDELSGGLEADVVAYEDADKESLAETLTGFSTVEFPGFLGRVRRNFSAVLKISNFANEPLRYKLIAAGSGDASLLKRPVSVDVAPSQTGDLVLALRLPRGLPTGRQSLPLRIEFADPETHISPLAGELEFDYRPGFLWLRTITLRYLLYSLLVLVLIAAVVLLFLVIRRRLQDAAFARFFEGISERRRGRKRMRPLIMKVESQNPNIGVRNIHRVPPGRKLSVGGDGSSFLIYYLPMPRRIGDVGNDGKRYRFIPKKLEYFPDLEKPLVDCLDKPIRAVSQRGREVVFRFSEYISPLEELNRLMRSVPKFHIDNVPLKGRRS